MAKANLRLKRPSSHTRLLSRVIILDVVWGGFSPLVAFLLRDGTIQHPASVATYCVIAFLVSLLVFQWFQTSAPIARFYSLRDAFELLKACVLIAALSAAAAFVVTRLEEAPRSIPIIHFMLLASGLLGARVLLRLRDSRRQARMPDRSARAEHVLIIEASRLAWFFSRMVEEIAPGSHQIVALLDQRPQMQNRSLNGYPIVGVPADLETVIADYAAHGVSIDTVVLAAQPQELSDSDWQTVSAVCKRLNIDLEVLPERLISERSFHADAAQAPLPAQTEILESELPPSLRSAFWTVKRGIDLAVAVTLALILSPLILVVCLLVLADVGIPVVFWQQRLGRNGTPLHLYKFRTLHTLFDRRTKEKREATSPSAVGRFLRATRLDEMPQLWNVLSGDMSIIGPRPLLPVDQPQDTTLRLAVRPGLTGWAQVSGGRLISIEEKNALDEWYIRHASFSLDAYIVLRTMWMMLAGEKRDEGAIRLALRERAPDAPAREPAPAPPPAENTVDLSNGPEIASAKAESTGGLSSLPNAAVAPAWAQPQRNLVSGTDALSSGRRRVG